jgi:hypothetical protein
MLGKNMYAYIYCLSIYKVGADENSVVFYVCKDDIPINLLLAGHIFLKLLLFHSEKWMLISRDNSQEK